MTDAANGRDENGSNGGKAEKGDSAEKAEKALRRAEEARGLLDPADRYKALINGVKQAQDLIEMGDRKARFALVIMSVLMDNLTTELADQLYTLSMVNQQKYAALDRLYVGVSVMTALFGAILATLGLYHLVH